MPWEVKEKNGKFCVHKKGSDSPVKCHGSRAEALKHQRALYANAYSEKAQFALIPVKQFSQTAEGELAWVQAYKFTTVHHPVYGEVVFTRDNAERMKQNFERNVIGIELSTDYEHGLDVAKGDKASGAVRAMDVRDDGMYWGIQFTDTAKQEIANDEWKYFSPKWKDLYEDNETRFVYEDVAISGALTNNPVYRGMAPVNFSEVFAEVVDLEHSEPGTGSPPEPRDTNAEEDLAIKSGSRRDPPPAAYEDRLKGGEMDVIAELRTLFGIDEDADLVATAKELKESVKPLEEAVKAASEKASFAEQFPDAAKEMDELRARDRDNTAKAFSERYERFVKKGDEGQPDEPLTIGFSALVLEKVEGLHKKFSEKAATHEDLQEVMDLIASDKGTVDYGEIGSSRTKETAPLTGSEAKGPGFAFAEKVTEVMKADGLEYPAAVKVAADKYPEEFKAYRDRTPVLS